MKEMFFTMRVTSNLTKAETLSQLRHMLGNEEYGDSGIMVHGIKPVADNPRGTCK